MRIRNVIVLMCLLCVVALRGVEAFEVTSVNLHLYLSGLKEARAPVVLEGHLILSAAGAYRFVGAAFPYDHWRSVHPSEITRFGAFVLAVPLPHGPSASVRYRLVLDGLWASDPANPLSERDSATGAAMSLVALPDRPRTVLGVWDPAGEGGASFFFRGAPGQRITVAGTFNGWDPFIHELEEMSPGEYELWLNLPPGEHQYVFMYRGERIADPLNTKLLYGKDGRPVSALTIAAAD